MNTQRRGMPMDMLGQTSLDPWYGTTAAARGAMMNTHIGQAPVIEDNEPRRIFTGAEFLYGAQTFDIRFPVHAQVLKVLRKYPTGIAGDSIKKNPVTYVIYEDFYSQYKTVGVLVIPEFNSLHQDFGYRYEKNMEVWENLREGACFEKDTVLAHSSAVKKNGTYGLGLSATVAFMSHPGTIEDGFCMSESFCRRLSPRIYNTAIANSGRKAFLLNLYGTDEVYKPFPDIGEKIRADGVIFALRDIDDDLSPADMTPKALRTIDRSFDRPVIGKPGARVVDITVFHDTATNPQATPIGMEKQLEKYYEAFASFYRDVLSIYQSLVRRRPGVGSLKLTPEMNQLVYEAQQYLPAPSNQRKLTRMHRLDTLDEWRVELTYETTMTPAGGYKATDLAGGKGVNCFTMPDDHMPVDQQGVRSEVIIYGSSTHRRANYGRMYEHFINACSRDLLMRLRTKFGWNPHLRPTTHQLQALQQDGQALDDVFQTLLRYYHIVSPDHYEIAIAHPDPRQYTLSVLQDKMYKKPGMNLYSPPDNPVSLLNMTRSLVKGEFRPHFGPVTYVDTGGNRVTTVENVLLGEIQIIMLEKIGEDWSAVASVKTQHFGLPAKVTNADKASTPGREAAVRSMGESETRSAICTAGPWATNALLDHTHNPASRRYAVENVLTHKTPTNIDVIVDHDKIPFGDSRSVLLWQHLFECRGLRFKYIPDSRG